MYSQSLFINFEMAALLFMYGPARSQWLTILAGSLKLVFLMDLFLKVMFDVTDISHLPVALIDIV